MKRRKLALTRFYLYALLILAVLPQCYSAIGNPSVFPPIVRKPETQLTITGTTSPNHYIGGVIGASNTPLPTTYAFDSNFTIFFPGPVPAPATTSGTGPQAVPIVLLDRTDLGVGSAQVWYDATAPQISAVSADPKKVTNGEVVVKVKFGEPMNQDVTPHVVMRIQTSASGTTGTEMEFVELIGVPVDPTVSDLGWGDIVGTGDIAGPDEYSVVFRIPPSVRSGTGIVGVYGAVDVAGNSFPGTGNTTPEGGAIEIETNTLTTKPVLTNPASEGFESVDTFYPKFTWTNATQVAGHAPARTRLLITSTKPAVGSSIAPSTASLNFMDVTSPYKPSAKMTKELDYWWQIWNYDTAGNIITSEVSSRFRIAPKAPSITNKDQITYQYDPASFGILALTDVEGTIADPIKPGNLQVSITFDEPMNTDIDPVFTVLLSNGQQFTSYNPPNDTTMGWSTADNKLYKTQFTMSPTYPTGWVSLGVQNAYDANDNVLGNSTEIDKFYFSSRTLPTDASGISLESPAPPPYNYEPENVNSLSPTFRWTNASGSVKTVLMIGTTYPGNNKTLAANVFSAEVNYSPYTLPVPLTNEQTYLWQILNEDAGGNQLTSEVSSVFTINVNKILLKKVEDTTNPTRFNGKNKFETSDPTPKFYWTSGIDPSWTYKFEISDNPSFHHPLTASADFVKAIAANTETSMTISNEASITEEGVYWWRVQANDSSGHVNSMSDYWQITFDYTPPKPPALLTPEADYLTKEESIGFSWSQIDDANTYELQLNTATDFAPASSYLTQEVTRGTSWLTCAATVNVVENVYFWRVLSIDKAGNKSDKINQSTNLPYYNSIPYRKLVVDQTPPEVSRIKLLTPENYAHVNDSTPVFAWSIERPANSASADLENVTKTYFELATDNMFSQVIMTKEIDTSSVFSSTTNATPEFSFEMTSPVLSDEAGVYYWRVKIKDQSGNYSLPSGDNEFKLDLTAPSSPGIQILSKYKKEGNQFQVTSNTINVRVNLIKEAMSVYTYGIGTSNPPDYQQKIYIYKVSDQVTSDSGTSYVLSHLIATGYAGLEDTYVDMSINMGVQDGFHKIIAIAEDLAGNKSSNQGGGTNNAMEIIVDKNNPQITHLVLSDMKVGSGSVNFGFDVNSIPPGYTVGDISGQIIVSIEFSEPMKTVNDSNSYIKPTVSTTSYANLQLPNALSHPSGTSGWSTDGKTWTGVISIPKGEGFDGPATLRISGDEVVDLAGSNFEPNPAVYSNYFVIDTAPQFIFKQFFNPADEMDLIFYLKASESLRTLPAIEVKNMGDIETLMVNRITNNIYAGTYRIPSDTTGRLYIKVYGTDMAGNTSMYEYDFSTYRVSPKAPVVALSSDEVLQVSVQEGSVDSEISLTMIKNNGGIVPESSVEQKLIEKDTVLKMSLKDSVEENSNTTIQELIPVGNAYDLSASKIIFQKEILFQRKLEDGEVLGHDVSKLGLFVNYGGKWNYIGSEFTDGMIQGKSFKTGKVAVFEDRKSPDLLNTSHGEGEELDTSYTSVWFEAQDLGCGFDNSCANLKMDGKEVEFKVEEGRVVYTPLAPLKKGNHTFELELSDYVGNKMEMKQVTIAAPAEFEVTEFYNKPNPVRGNQTEMVYSLTQVGTMARARIYDGKGDLVWDFEEDLPANKTNPSLVWRLMNNDFRPVANGVYFAKIEAWDSAGKRVSRTCKIAVLR